MEGQNNRSEGAERLEFKYDVFCKLQINLKQRKKLKKLESDLSFILLFNPTGSKKKGEIEFLFMM